MLKKTTAHSDTDPPTTTPTTVPATTAWTSTESSIVNKVTTTPYAEIPETTSWYDIPEETSSNLNLESMESSPFATSSTTKPQTTTIPMFESTKTTVIDTFMNANMTSNGGFSSERVSAARGVFCFWLFVGCVFLCVVAAVSSILTAVRLYFWYRKVYISLRCVFLRKKGFKMETYGCGFVQAQAKYRTVLFVAKNAKENECFISLGPKDAILEAKNDEKSVHMQTMHRVFSKEQEIKAEEALAEAGASPEAKELKLKKSYRVILREVRERDNGGEEKCDWVVGGWEAESGGEAPGGNSWGAWLGQVLPRMPWGVSAPPRSEAESEESKEE